METGKGPKLVALANQKGGVGKSTSASAIAAELGRRGKKTLLIDFDPQGNQALWYDIDLKDGDMTAREVLLEKARWSDAILPLPHFDLLPSDEYLVDVEMSAMTNTAIGCLLLRRAIERLDRPYDFIIIDCPPSPGPLTVNALSAAQHVLVPMAAAKFSEAGVSKLAEIIEQVRSSFNPSLVSDGVFFCKVDMRQNLSKRMEERMAKTGEILKMPLLSSTIRPSVRVNEAQENGKDIIDYPPAEKQAEDYKNLVGELFERGIW